MLVRWADLLIFLLSCSSETALVLLAIVIRLLLILLNVFVILSCDCWFARDCNLLDVPFAIVVRFAILIRLTILIRVLIPIPIWNQ